MKIISWNINGLRAVIKKGFLDFVNLYDPDILCLQEIKIDKDILFPSNKELYFFTDNPNNELIDLLNYHEYWNPATKKGYSGTAIITKPTPLNLVTDTAISTATAEGRVMIAEYEYFFLINVYVPNSKDDLSRIDLRKNSFDPSLLSLIKTYEKEKPVIICGDFNVAHQAIDVSNPSTKKGKHGFTEEEREGFQNYLEAGLVDIFRNLYPEKVAYTWWSYLGNARARDSGWRIDYFLISQSIMKNVIDVKILHDVLGSDHAPIFLEIKL